MNIWVWVVLLLLLVGAIEYYFYPKQDNVEAKPTIQYTKPIGPTQEPPYRLKSEVIHGYT